jgi:AmmeMemoRadiSam system protein B
VCPHDDHLYAGRVYVHVTERITAPRVILIGVFHKAALWPVQDRLVFDSFEAWHGPWGPVAVDPLRDELVERLDPDLRIVDNTMHCREHSLEALVPFLARGAPRRTLVPILVPHMHWDRLQLLTTQLGNILSEIMLRRGWRLGRDVAIVISSDAVHYGPDFDHAPFGTGPRSYEQAVGRDQEMVRTFLQGPLEQERLRGLFESLVDPETLDYRVPWCGRFSVPFGLELLRKVAMQTANAIPRGQLLRYGTSLSEPELPVSAATRGSGLGYTAPSNLHHWVGYAAIGFRLPEQ